MRAVGAVHDLAYLNIRIIESFSYADLITGEVPDARNVQVAIAALLHADPEPLVRIDEP